jgi:hypothetical protein
MHDACSQYSTETTKKREGLTAVQPGAAGTK